MNIRFSLDDVGSKHAVEYYALVFFYMLELGLTPKEVYSRINKFTDAIYERNNPGVWDLHFHESPCNLAWDLAGRHVVENGSRDNYEQWMDKVKELKEQYDIGF